MKKITLTLTALLFSVTLLQAQNNDKTKNVQEETIIKTTTVKGVTDKITVTKIVKEKEQVINVSDTGSENQDINYATKRDETIKHTSSEIKVNKENQAAIKGEKLKLEAEIKASKEAQKAKYEAERIALKKKEAVDVKRKKDSIHKKYQKENN
ncbi:MAG: hypothetical protein COB12_01545 [Flavobacterium sp.]|nr:MAG: hypothetical protein COB12_01545 [Flavobacterium sp.]